jgi:hypothetical protein
MWAYEVRASRGWPNPSFYTYIYPHTFINVYTRELTSSPTKRHVNVLKKTESINTQHRSQTKPPLAFGSLLPRSETVARRQIN